MERRSYCPCFMDPWSSQQTAISSLNVHDLEGDLKYMWTNCHGKVDFADNRFSRSIKCFDNYTTELHRHLKQLVRNHQNEINEVAIDYLFIPKNAKGKHRLKPIKK